MEPCHYDAVVACVTGARVRSRPREITVRSTKHLNQDHLCLDLLTADWSTVYGALSPSEKYDAWLTVWDGLINQHMPLTQIKVRNRPCPWVSHGDGDLKQLMTDRDNARTEKDQNPCPATWQAYRGLRNAVKTRLAAARSAHFRHTFKNSKTVHWKDIRKYSPQQLLPSTCGRPVWGT